MKNIFLSALKDCVKAIKKNWSIVVILIILQVGFIALLGSVQIHYQFQIFEKSEEVTNYVNQLPLEDTESILQQQNVLGDNPALVAEGAKVIQDALIKLVGFTVLIILFFNLLNWALADELFRKKKRKEWVQYAGKFIAVSAIYYAVYVILINTFLQSGLSDYLIEEAAHLRTIPSLVLLVVTYFMFISFALVGSTKLKDIAKKTITISFRKGHWVLITYATNIGLLLLTGRIFFQAGYASYGVLAGLGIVFLGMFVWGRILIIATVNHLRN